MQGARARNYNKDCSAYVPKERKGLSCHKEINKSSPAADYNIITYCSRDRIEKLISNGTTVLIDRYAFSGVAFSAVKPVSTDFQFKF